MKLMENENTLITSDSKELVLTTHRVRQHAKKLGQQTLISIMLDEITSCSYEYKGNMIWIILAGLSFILGISASSILGAIIGSAIFAAIYFYTRKITLVISSAKQEINADVTGMNPKAIEEYIDSIESAKFKIRKLK